MIRRSIIIECSADFSETVIMIWLLPWAGRPQSQPQRLVCLQLQPVSHVWSPPTVQIWCLTPFLARSVKNDSLAWESYVRDFQEADIPYRCQTIIWISHRCQKNTSSLRFPPGDVSHCIVPCVECLQQIKSSVIRQYFQENESCHI